MKRHWGRRELGVFEITKRKSHLEKGKSVRKVRARVREDGRGETLEKVVFGFYSAYSRRPFNDFKWEMMGSG